MESENPKNKIYLELIEIYKREIQQDANKGELYKWEAIQKFQDEWNSHSVFDSELLSKTQFHNLIYYSSLNYLKLCAKHEPLTLITELGALFDESTPLQKRILDFQEASAQTILRVSPNRILKAHQEERAIATYLTFRYPEKYTFYKNSFYSKLLKRLGLKEPPVNERFIHYLELIREFKSDFIEKDTELLALAKSTLSSECYADKEHNLLAQDILYRTLDGYKVRGIQYWRIGTSDEDYNVWSEMKENNIVAIGWNYLGDLDLIENINRDSLIGMMYPKPYAQKNVASRKAGEVLDFYQIIKPNDIVLACNGSTVEGIGRIIGDYESNEGFYFNNIRPVQWLKFAPDFKTMAGLQTSVYKLEDRNLINQIESAVGQENTITETTQPMKKEISLNTILYGPPGTGKTFNTINYAVSIIENIDIKELEKEKRADLNKRFNKYKDDFRIQFVTFHQSMSYEDFVEGIKPVIDDNQPIYSNSIYADYGMTGNVKTASDIKYEYRPGILYECAAFAAYEYYKVSAKKAGGYDFDYLYDCYLEHVKPTKDQHAAPILHEILTKTGFPVVIKRINKNKSIVTEAKNSKRMQEGPAKTKKAIKKLYDKYEEVKSITHISQLNDITGLTINSSGYWGLITDLKKFETNEFKQDLDKSGYLTNELDSEISFGGIIDAFRNGDFSEYISKDVLVPKYVLIIDEINRGNVSQIFGELITLIEDDKRIGCDNALDSILPYSQNYFGLPPNLFIVGTMNTADRSVEALDTALRRRFSFVEMPPNYDIPELNNIIILNVSKGKLLQTINDRLEKLLSKDHLIGHSFFLPMKTEADLMDVFYDKIIPMLQEYFHGDYAKIGLVLGKGFVAEKELDNVFASFNHADLPTLEERKLYTIIDYRNSTHTIEGKETDFMGAIKLLL